MTKSRNIITRWTTETWVHKVRELHKDRYDYSKVTYKDSKTKVVIICPIHGEFEQNPQVHLRGNGCKKCATTLTKTKMLKTQEYFISKAIAAHGDRYDYSKAVYKKARDKVTIICKEHGEFEQEAHSHTSGAGCPRCYGNILKTTEDFIEACRSVHGDRYDYSKVEYSGNKNKVEIVCMVHGSFFQAPDHHSVGGGCPKCALVDARNRLQKDLSYFLRRALEVHGDKYDYSLVDYKQSNQKVNIICRVHGKFKQAPANHLVGQGCPVCASELKGTYNLKDTEQFIVEAVAVHGYKYDYSKVEYITCKDKVTIICPKHGEFLQVPSSHAGQGAGCPKCAEYGYRPDKDGTFYIYTGDFVGFGITNYFEQRDERHQLNFNKHSANMVLHKTYELDGETTLNLETTIKREFKLHIINTGIDGFKTEALPMDHLSSLEQFVENFLTQQTLQRKIELPSEQEVLNEVSHTETNQQNFVDRAQRYTYNRFNDSRQHIEVV